MKNQKRILLAIAIFSFILLGMSGGLLNIAWTYMQDTFSVDVSRIGILLIFATSGSLVASFASGTVIGRHGLGRVTALGVALVIAGASAAAFSPVWVLLLLAFFIFGLGRGTLDAGMNNFVSENYGAAAMNGLHASWGLGLTIAPMYMAFILINRELTWRWGYAVMAAILVVLLILVLWQFRSWDRLTDSSEDEKGKHELVNRASAVKSIQHAPVVWSALLCFVYGGVEIGTGQLMNTLLVEGRGISQEIAASWIGFYWGSFTVGRLLVSVILLCFTDKLVMQFGLLFAVVGASGLLFSEIPILNLLGLILLGLGIAPFFPILISQAPQRVGREHAANSIGFQVGFGGLGGALLPGLIGLTTSVFGLEAIATSIFINTLVVVAVYQWVVRTYRVQSQAVQV